MIIRAGLYLLSALSRSSGQARVSPGRGLARLSALCLSAGVSLTALPVLAQENANAGINPAHNGAWFNPQTDGQGFFLDVLPETNLAFLSWFTYDTEPPAQGATAQVGNPGHRWLIAQGPLSSNGANLDVYVASGGLFDDPAKVVNTPAGNITLSFDDCDSGTVEYDLTTAGVSGSISIARLADDNVALCNSVSGTLALPTARPEGVTMQDASAVKQSGGMRTMALAQNCALNPGHSGAWFNPQTDGQGFFLDVLPETNLAFLSWFTYDAEPPGQGATAQVGNPGHRWLIAQGPLNGKNANLDVYIASGGLFDDPAKVVNTPAGNITLSFDDCDSGTVEYNLTAGGLSGSIPISRLAGDNVAYCESLCGQIVVAESGRQSAVYGLEGGVLDVADSQNNVSRLTIPQGALVGPRAQSIDAAPLTTQTRLPTGHAALAGIQWSAEGGAVLGPATVEFFSEEAARFEDLAAFQYAPEGEAFYFVPLRFREDIGVVLEAPIATQGAIGLVAITAAEMEEWTPPAHPPRARILQRMAVARKQAAQAAASQQAVRKSISGATLLGEDRDGPVSPEQVAWQDVAVSSLQEWFDRELAPSLGTVDGGCDVADDFINEGVMWLGAIQIDGLESHPGLSGRISSLESAFARLAAAASQDIAELDQACEVQSDPCKQTEIAQKGLVCSQAMQYIGEDAGVTDIACSGAVAVLLLTPQNAALCPGQNVNFSAVATNFEGEPLSLEQGELRWSSQSPGQVRIDPASGSAETLAEGGAWITATSELCGEELSGRAYVKVKGAPDIAGSYSMVGSETWRGCLDAEDNGVYGIRGSASIRSSGGSGGSTSFSGSSNGSGFGASFSGTVSCGGAVSGSGSYSEPDTKGVTNFTGSFVGNTLMLDFTAQDTAGDTCSSSGWVRCAKSN